MRLFIAIDIPKSKKDEIALVSEKLKPFLVGGNFVNREHFHITLAFLGDSYDQDSIIKAMQMTDFESFYVRFHKLGMFPAGEKRIYWLGTDETKGLKNLANLLKKNLGKFGIQLSDREFNPHITLARKVANKIEMDEIVPEKAFMVSQMVLFDSVRIDGKLCYIPLYIKESKE